MTATQPVLDKWAAFADTASTIHEFLEWCEQQGWELRETATDHPIMLNTDEVLYRYAEIDASELDDARRALLNADTST